MGPCVNHPDKETSYQCIKHNIYMCEECLDCRDPDIYCKSRTSCPIHFLTKRKGNLDGDVEISDHQQSWGYDEGPWKGPGSAGGR